VKGDVMILLTATLGVTALLAAYLLVAMLRPEWF
jgi:K+-transporting ATPase KdpF subunit